MHTFLQAKEHLEAVIKLACPENRYLSCVREYLSCVELNMMSLIRAQEVRTTERLIEILDLQTKAEHQVRLFLVGGM